MNGISCGPRPPNGAIAVIFISQRNTDDDPGYMAAAAAMEAQVATQPGYCGHVGTRGADGLGITVSYWESEQHASAWRRQADHAAIRAMGKARWYDAWQLVVAHISRVEQGAAASRPAQTG